MRVFGSAWPVQACLVFAILLLVPVHSEAQDTPPLPELSQAVEGDTRKALEKMEEALMDQIQREDMQAAEMASVNGSAVAEADAGVQPKSDSVQDPAAPADMNATTTQPRRAAQAAASPEPAGATRKKTVPVPAPTIVPEQDQTTKIPVYIRDSGVDQAGLRLGFFARETFSASSQFFLSNRNERKIVIRIDSRPEFPTRPGLSSIYAATWILVEDESTVPYYLATQIGVVSPDSARMEADRIVSRTARILEQFAYLFE